MPESESSREILKLLLEHSRTTQWVVTIQLIAAVLMIGVEACLLWGILKAARILDRKVVPSVDGLIAKIMYLTLKLEFMLKKMGWESPTELMQGVPGADEVDAELRAILQQSQAAAGMGLPAEAAAPTEDS